MSTQVLYQTRLEMIKGTLTFKMDHLEFNAIKSKNSEKVQGTEYDVE